MTERNQEVVKEARRLLWSLVNCAYCGRKGLPGLDPDSKPWHMDHIYPLYRGGADHIDNITKACAACNMDKGAEDWRNLTTGILTAGKAKELKAQGCRNLSHTNQYLAKKRAAGVRRRIREAQWEREDKRKAKVDKRTVRKVPPPSGHVVEQDGKVTVNGKSLEKSVRSTQRRPVG